MISLAGSILLLAMASGLIQESKLPLASTKPAPQYQNVRLEEDFSRLDASLRTGWSRLKAIPLDPRGNSTLSLGGQLRARAEFWDDFLLSPSSIADDAFGLLRLRLHGDLRLGSHVRIFVEGKSSLASGRMLPGGNRTLDTDSIDLQNALFEVNWSSEERIITFRGGRQELQFGRQRLVSPLDWSNTRPRAFDGFSGRWQEGRWTVDGFWTEHVRLQKYRFNRSDSGTRFFGLYLTGKPDSNWTTEFYWLGLNRDRTSFGGVNGPEERQTIGTRLARSNWHGSAIELESAYQFGHFNGLNIGAAMVALEWSHQWAARAKAPRVKLGFDYASGDSDPADRSLGTFNQLFPLGHAYLGFADFVGRQNIIDFSKGVSLQLLPRVSTALDHHQFWRASPSDALYNAGTGVVLPAMAGESRQVGSEVDWSLTWTLDRHLVLGFGYTHFRPGDLLQANGSRATDFGYVSAQYTF